jgi:serine/threonine protein phosphatase 1
MPRLLAVGDVHGCSLHLDALLAAVRPTAADRIIFLGDLVDRGPDTRGVLGRVLALKAELDVTCLRGNHELLMARARTDPDVRREWLSVGGAETLASYSPVPGRIPDLTAVPEAHWAFVEDGCVNYVETDSAILVHAGLDPDLPPDDQFDSLLFWEFLTGPIRHESGKTVICGHTSQKSGMIWDMGPTICIDTAAYKGGKLTCLDVTTWHYWQADLFGRVTEGDLPARG